MTPRYFTPEEAAQALELVRPVAERMVEHARALRSALARRSAVAAAAAGNGGGTSPGELAALAEEVDEATQGVRRCVEEILELGVLVKDVDGGLVDFPARRGSDEVLLCWRVGEPEIAFWHGTNEGFAGRKPLPL